MEVDMIEEILCRVDAKSLIRLKCVCKLWYSLIKDPYFIGRHLKRAKEEADSSSDLIICSQFNFCRLENINFCGDMEQVKLHLCSIVGGAPATATATATDGNIVLTKSGYEWRSMLPCCNGLICLFDLYCYFPIHIFNPATRESLILPTPNCGHSRYCRSRVELGFHPCTNYYKVLLFWSTWERGGDADECQVFTLGGGGSCGSSNSWRSLGNTGYHLYSYSSTCAARGVLYWTVCGLKRFYVGSDYIVSFDLEDEKFRKIPLPYLDGERERSNRLNLMEVRERVYLVDTYYKKHIDLWVFELEDSPKKNYSWIKKYTIDLVDDIRLFGKLIWFRGNRLEILVIQTKKRIVYYDSRTKQITDVYERRKPEIDFDGRVYIQSLVSLTDDLMILTKKSFCLSGYNDASGQGINYSKSRFFLPKTATHHKISLVENNLGFCKGLLQSTYLGVPLFNGRLTKESCWSLV